MCSKLVYYYTHRRQITLKLELFTSNCDFDIMAQATVESHDRGRAVTLVIVTILWMLSLAMYCWAVYLLVGKVIKFGE